MNLKETKYKHVSLDLHRLKDICSPMDVWATAYFIRADNHEIGRRYPLRVGSPSYCRLLRLMLKLTP